MDLSARTHRRARPRSGLTLTELLALLAVSIIIAGLTLVALGSARRRATDLACVNHLRQLAFSFRMYADRHQGRLPAGQPDPWFVEIGREGDLPAELFQCPAASDQSAISYAWRDEFSVAPAASLAGRQLDLAANQNLILVFEKSPGWHLPDRINAATLGGAIQSYSTEDWEDNLLLSVTTGQPFPLDN